MFKQRVALLGVLALFVASGIAASAASASGPFWHVNGSKLVSGETKVVNLQIKGTAVLSATISGSEVKVECTSSVSEGAQIEGSTTSQGQGKGKVTYTGCKVVKPNECTVVEPIKTVALKSHLVVNPNSKQQKFAELFEPTEGKKFVELDFKGTGCGVIAGFEPVAGSVAAEVQPIEKEGQEGLLNFPSSPISEVLLEQVVVKPGLTLAGDAAVFQGAYGAKLASGEKWGAFGT